MGCTIVTALQTGFRIENRFETNRIIRGMAFHRTHNFIQKSGGISGM